MLQLLPYVVIFFFNDTATTEIYTLSLHDALPIFKAFYDIDTPITVAALDAGGAEYLKPEHVAGFDIYFSFTSGPVLRKLESKFGAQRAVPLYCSFDPGNNQLSTQQSRFASDLSYMGTYAPDRQL